MASTLDSTATEPEAKKLLSCYQCRARKLKCSRVWPCGRCQESGDKCEFPTSRQKPKEPVKRPRFKHLESKIHELEHRFKDDEPVDGPPRHTGSSVQGQADYPSPVSFSSELLQTGRLEQQPPGDLVDELTNLYFLQVYQNAPIQHPGRYFASLRKPPHLQPPLCLQYIILAMGAMVSPQHKDLALPFYHRAKNYMHHDDMTDDGYLGMTVAHAQCWELLGHFEARQLWFTRAPASISRSVRLAQMLGLDTIDGGGSRPSASVLPPARDWSELEERRRTMWSIFCSDLDTSSSTGWPTLLDPQKIHTLLPASDESFIQNFPERSISLRTALRDSSSQYSDYACRILATLLFHECSSHTMQKYTTNNHDSSDNDGAAELFDINTAEDFARTHQRLDNRLALMFMALPSRLAQPSNTVDGKLEPPPIVLKLHTSVIAIHRTYLARLRAGDIPSNNNNPSGSASGSGGDSSAFVAAQAASSAARMLVSADQIFALLVATSSQDPSADFASLFVTFAAFMASFAFLEDFAASQSPASEHKLGVLMDLLVAGAEGNSMAGSLAVQLGHEMYRTGMDRGALGKVMHIINKMQPGYQETLMGQQDEQSGGTLFCPLAKASPSGGAT
ncbi:binuclear zinc transcription factor [Microdochium bolleyi]|uniref:Binuclear zinc transcription factor n=1 Tax=Microdochium bolleyi TaxID=196109 RepID=A0A136JCS4_9PEZI|nr:binuclear zinc transcription factor [Microdochium bolleyi]